MLVSPLVINQRRPAFWEGPTCYLQEAHTKRPQAKFHAEALFLLGNYQGQSYFFLFSVSALLAKPPSGRHCVLSRASRSFLRFLFGFTKSGSIVSMNTTRKLISTVDAGKSLRAPLFCFFSASHLSFRAAFPHSFQGSFFLEYLRKPRENCRFLKNRITEQMKNQSHGNPGESNPT